MWRWEVCRWQRLGNVVLERMERKTTSLLYNAYIVQIHTKNIFIKLESLLYCRISIRTNLLFQKGNTYGFNE